MTETSITTLNNLIATLKDGELGFKSASEDATSPELKQIFAEYCSQRAEFSRVLQSLVQLSGGNPTLDGSIAGALHRGWLNAKAAVSSRTDLAILEVCETGEDSALARYRESLTEDDLGTARGTVQEQFEHLRLAHDHIRSLRDALTHSS
jgi:uncharacterized protein (TIGR02284 family)